MKETMKMVAADKLHPNPDNPRKALGDLSELADSIKKNGVMQNLAVIPFEGKPGEYMIVMGHRRHAAAVRAGLRELPCRVMEKLERSDQVAAMLAENLQRSNLTPYEEGQGFQLMLDLGETEQTICEKTGFGKTTVRHRINIAKLDQEKLKERQDDPSFQLSLTDLVALEKVPDIKKRNEILGEAKDSRDLAHKAQCAANELKREANLARAIPMLEKAGVRPLPDKAAVEIYDSGKWQVVETFNLEADLPESYQPKQAGELYHYKTYREIKIFRRAEKKPKASREPKTEAEKKKQEQEALQKKNRKQLLEAAKEADALRRDFILGVIAGKIPGIKGDDLMKAQDALWRIIYEDGAYVSRNGCIAFYGGKDDYYSVPPEEREEAGKWADRLEMVHQMLIVAHNGCSCKGLVGSNGEYNAKAAGKAKKLYAALRLFGLRTEKETKLILDGRHGLYYTKPASAEEPAMIGDKAAEAKAKTEAGAQPAAESGAKAGPGKGGGAKDKPTEKAKAAKKPKATKAEAVKAPATEAGTAAKAEPAKKPAAGIGPAGAQKAKTEPMAGAGPAEAPEAKAEPARGPMATDRATVGEASRDRPKAGPAAAAESSPGAEPDKDGPQQTSSAKTQAA